MTLDEIKNSIQFKTVQPTENTTVISATLTLQADRFINRTAYPHIDAIMAAELRSQMVEEILRALYDDHGKEIRDAIVGLMYASPFSDGFRAALDRVVVAAQRQKPV